MENMAVRVALKQRGVKAWELAEAMGIVDCTLSKWMRRELPPDKQAIMIHTIEQIAERKQENRNGN